MKISEVRAKSVDELKTQLKDLYKTQFNFRFVKAAKEMVKPHSVRAAKLSIARIKTVLKEKLNRGAENA